MILPIFNWRRIGLIAGLIAIFLVMVYLIYLAFFAPSRPGPNENGTPSNGQLPNSNGATNRPAGGNQNGTGTLPGINGGIERPSEVANGGKTVAPVVVDTPSNSLTLAGNGVDLIYYDPATGKFFQLDHAGGGKRVLSDQSFKGVEKVTWAPNKQMAVMTFKDGSNITYDFSKKKQVTLPQELSDFSFSPDSSKLAAKLNRGADDNWLTVFNNDGSGAQTIESLGNKENQVSVNWSPNNQVVATWQRGMDGDRQEIVPIGLNNENFKSIETNGRGFDGQWDRNGQRLLYSVHNAETSFNPTLYIVQSQGDAIGQGNVRLGLNTWADMCAFGTGANDLYCAVPRALPTGSGLYPEMASSSPFDFYRVDLSTGGQELLAQPTDSDGIAQYSVSSVFISALGDQLYFTDAEGKIHTIALRK